MKFMDLSSKYEKSEIVILGIPYDGTTSYRPGTRFAPQDIRVDSLIGYETYSPKLNKDLEEINICDMGDLDLSLSDPIEVHKQIYTKYKNVLLDNKKIATIGGEHSITGSIIKAYKEKYPKLKVIHLDAHTDLRDEYLGSQLSHASVMKRVVKEIGPNNLYQFGIRSGLKEEFDYAKENINFYPYSLEGLDKVVEQLKDEDVYVSIDLDVLDPAFFSGTGTPEPDGITSREFFQALFELSNLNNIVGFDLVELAPRLDNSGASLALAIKALRELLLIV